MNLKYKDYTGWYEYDDEAGIYYGEVAGLRAVITFESPYEEEIEKEFRTSIDVYLDWCEERGKEPEKPFSGEITLRVSPEMHKKIDQVSRSSGCYVDEWVLNWIQRGLEESKLDKVAG